MSNLFNEVKKYCSENVMSCRLCEKEPWFTKIRERIKNKDATWTRGHLPYVGPRFGEFPKLVFIGYDDPYRKSYTMDKLQKLLLKKCANDFKKDNHRKGEILFIKEILNNLLSKPFSESKDYFKRVSTFNCHLCSLVKEGNSTSMVQLLKGQCSHIRPLIEMLSPDVIIIEGVKQWDSRDSTRNTLQEIGQLTQLKDLVKGSLWTLQLKTNKKILVLFLHHPSRSWDSENRAYYKEIVQPLIKDCAQKLKIYR